MSLIPELWEAQGTPGCLSQKLSQPTYFCRCNRQVRPRDSAQTWLSGASDLVFYTLASGSLLSQRATRAALA